MSNVSATPSLFNLDLDAVEWHALQAAAKRPTSDSRDDLSPGVHKVDFTVRVHGTVKVGEDFTSSTSWTPGVETIIGYLLGKMNEATRAAVLRDLPAEFRKSGEMPAVDASHVQAAQAMCKSLRQSKPITKRGSVSGALLVDVVDEKAASLALVG